MIDRIFMLTVGRVYIYICKHYIAIDQSIITICFYMVNQCTTSSVRYISTSIVRYSRLDRKNLMIFAAKKLPEFKLLVFVGVQWLYCLPVPLLCILRLLLG